MAAGAEAYFEGRFAEAAVALKRTLSDDTAEANAVSGAAYLLGRSFEELGLRGLALHYFGRAEQAAAWRLPSLREIARSYLEIGEPLAVLDALERVPAGTRDPDILYLAGVAAATLGRWPDAEAILARILPGEDPYGYAAYVRAQARAARQDFDGALADLTAMANDERKIASELRDQARILRGKILYLQGRDADARTAFADVEPGGPAASEALRGLLLARSDARTAAEVTVSERRPTDAALLLFVRAVAAEEHGDAAAAAALRERLRDRIAIELRTLGSITKASPRSTVLEEDLANFAALLRRERWRARWSNEAELVAGQFSDGVPSRAPSPAAAFEPRLGLFYEAWNQARADPWLRGSIDLLSRCRDLARDIETDTGRPPFWRFWRRDEERRFATALVVLRTANLEQLYADHLHTLRAIPLEELRARKRASVEGAVSALRKLYIGDPVAFPDRLSYLRLGLEYKESDMHRLVDSAPDRSTDPTNSLFGNFVDLLDEARRELRGNGQKVPSRARRFDELLAKFRERNRRLAAEIEGRVRDVVDPTVRMQVALFTRLAADNESSLSRLYAEAQGGRKRR